MLLSIVRTIENFLVISGFYDHSRYHEILPAKSFDEQLNFPRHMYSPTTLTVQVGSEIRLGYEMNSNHYKETEFKQESQ